MIKNSKRILRSNYITSNFCVPLRANQTDTWTLTIQQEQQQQQKNYKWYIIIICRIKVK